MRQPSAETIERVFAILPATSPGIDYATAHDHAGAIGSAKYVGAVLRELESRGRAISLLDISTPTHWRRRYWRAMP